MFTNSEHGGYIILNSQKERAKYLQLQVLAYVAIVNREGTIMADWDKISSRGDVEDRRGNASYAAGGLAGSGIVGGLIILAFTLLSGGNSNVAINDVLDQLQSTTVQQQSVDSSEFAGNDSYETFASTVLGSNNDLWSSIFSNSDKVYTEPHLVLFRNATVSGCGTATYQVGPHYCPLDKTIYLDESFFDELKKYGAEGGDVAEAYVIAHEVGHHVQNELGIMDNIGDSESNESSVNLELQADCFAGVWAYSVSSAGVLQPGEINEAISEVEAVGDDRIQQTVEGQINPETWTHGSSAQRVKWFNAGYNTGSPSSCNTFGASN